MRGGHGGKHEVYFYHTSANWLKVLMEMLIWSAASLRCPNEALIPYSNGGLDPWSAGGVTQNITDSLVAIVIPDGAHHLDLRSRNPCDPKSVQQARALEVHYMKQWIAKAKHQHWSGTVTTVAVIPLLALLGSGPGLVVHALSVPLLLPYLCCSAQCCSCLQEK